MKKVLIIGMYNQHGGIEAFIMNFYRKLYTDFEFGFICMHEHIAYEEEINKLNGKIYKITNVKKNPKKCKKEIIEIIEKDNYDVIHVNMLSAANIIPLIAAKKARAKTIIAHSHNNGMPNSIVKKLLHYINKNKIKKYANVLLACSEEAGKWMFNNNEFTVISNSINVEKFKYNEKETLKLKKSLHLTNEKIYGHVGRFAYQKNHKYLIDVFYNILKKEKDSILLLVGSGELKDSIKEKVDKLKIEDKVIFIDETKEVYKYIWIMDYFLFPSFYEGLGIALIEAQAGGLQCFTSLNVPREVNINNSVVFEDIGIPAEQYANIIISNQRKMDKLKLNEDVRKSKYNINNEVEKLKNIYNEDLE